MRWMRWLVAVTATVAVFVWGLGLPYPLFADVF